MCVHIVKHAHIDNPPHILRITVQILNRLTHAMHISYHRLFVIMAILLRLPKPMQNLVITTNLIHTVEELKTK